MLNLLSLSLLVPPIIALPSLVQIRDSPITLPIAVRINTTGSRKLIEADRIRLNEFWKKAAQVTAGQSNSTSAFGIPLTSSGTSYTAEVGVGNPPTQYTVLIDSGSSNTWIGAGKPYNPSATSIKTNEKVSVIFGTGSMSGTEHLDQVTLGPGLVITNQSIGVASTSTGFQGVDGILGIGPVDLTLGTLSPSSLSTIPTVVDNMKAQKSIDSELVAASFQPTNSASTVNGELTFGGTDASKFTGDIIFTPITNTPPASGFWGIDQSIKYGKTSILMTTSGIVDTGTSLLLIASDAFQNYQKLTGGIMDEVTGLLRLTTAQFLALQSLHFMIGNTSFELTPNAQIWPRNLNSLIGGNPDSVYLIVGDLGTPSGSGLDVINGFVFLERFYAVFDTTNSRVGIATTKFTNATIN